ncbi:MAG: TIGR00296 family protein [Nitrososphaera sp.]|nr:TIGR00296 family protein [Nitrososphaera sp.]
MFSDSQGASLVRLARQAVTDFLENKPKPVADGGEKFGVFVTLNRLVNNEEQLRGCIGFPLPEMPVNESVIEAAIAAATQDPRFPAVTRKELDSINFEVSLLTVPEEIKSNPQRYNENIKIGEDGLILRWRYGSGLLLPQVPVELGWDVDEYLTNICYKAGAPSDAWLDKSSRLFKFQATIFKELEPSGRIARLNLNSTNNIA